MAREVTGLWMESISMWGQMSRMTAGKTVFIKRESMMVLWNSSLEGTFTDQIFEVDSSKILYRYNRGYIDNHYSEGRKEYFAPSLPSGFLEFDLSPDRTRLVGTVIQKGGLDPGAIALVTVDLSTKKVEKVMESTRFRPEFFARWGSNTTIITSLFCRKDLSYTSWEIDLQGKLLRRLTYYGMKL